MLIAFKVDSVKFAKSLSPPSIVKKERTENKKQPRDLSGAGQKSRELTTPPKLPNSFRLGNLATPHMLYWL